MSNIPKALKVRENIKQKNVSWTNWEIDFSWENDVIQYLWGLVKPLKQKSEKHMHVISF